MLIGGRARQDPEELLRREPEWFLGFTTIIASNVEPALELALGDLLWEGALADNRHGAKGGRRADH